MAHAVRLAAARPRAAFDDVLLFGPVEVGARRDPGLIRSPRNAGSSGRCVVRLLKQISLAHARFPTTSMAW
jgi:hypothetical protein